MAAQKQAPLPFHKQLLCGGIAGVSEILLMYPLDVIKTRAQLNAGKNVGMFTALKQLVNTEGFGMYRGIASPIMVEAPKRAVKFAANERYKPIFADKNGKIDQLGSVGAGTMAGITEAFVVVPFELVKIRMQNKDNAGLYKSTFDCFSKVLKNEGPRAMFQGLESTVWRHALWNGGYFGVIHWVNGVLPKPESKSGELFKNFVAGAIAGAFGTVLNTPADVVKTRIQNFRPAPGVVPKYNWAIPSMALIAKEEGVTALWKGFAPKVMRLGPGGGILLVVFNFMSDLLR